ncbi:hypothetical protein F5Y00DRAFT_262799 [Daldinia vernicosa]|uniref:uncharacterized protein n=1 Tax=Daldinia vernicosa TaxID=114800 RepID=UPI002008BB48|nr:uncharacterized protein F5Y00DRAFT_262799 [Daldinia vernicosa]KAI0848164.1 hypothetical protein F5Y00DRAFT_262799 [Daldinia vernicosa]
MAGFSRSFKPSSYLSSMKRRPPPPSRNMSSSSEASPLSSPDIRQDDIIFSTRPSPTPTMDNPSQKQHGASPNLRPIGGKKDPVLFDAPRSTPARAKPIAIELPTVKKVNSAPVYTPPAPLSARGDLPGGYFPLHEEQARIYRPHPFQLDASQARMKSIERASLSNSPGPEKTTSAKASKGVIPSTTAPVTMPESSFDSRSDTPVASYMPTGTQDSPLPMGKYYPSNYVKRKEEKRSRQTRPSTSTSLPPMGSKSESLVSTTRDSATLGHSRNESDAKRRLQQYQRDMIAQATLALNGGNVNAATLSSLRTIGFTAVPGPGKPRLAPLGSPGPVTPMELENAQDGYLGARSTADIQVEEIARAIRAEEERKRREGTTSPTVELGPSTF